MNPLPKPPSMSGKDETHPYLIGNYAPIAASLSSVPCAFEGSIPEEFYGGQYVRNGGNAEGDIGDRDYHWFDGDGMLTGVFFKRSSRASGVQPVFSNQYVMTDVHCAATENEGLRPIIPSMTTLMHPEPARYRIVYEIARFIFIAFASLLRLIAYPIKRVGAANTNILYHDGRVLATNEIGPPMRVLLPSLRTIGWFTGSRSEGERDSKDQTEPFFGGKSGIEGFYKEMTTAHPRVDPVTGELILFHSTFLPPFVQYSIVPASSAADAKPRLNLPVPGLSCGKLMHDFGVSREHTVIIDCPVTLDPGNIAQNKSAVVYDPAGRTRLGVFPRHSPEKVQWSETDACLVIHTANNWDENPSDGSTRVHMLLCRMNSLGPIYHMGGIEAPEDVCPDSPECRLYYYQFCSGITQQWALSSIPFEFPHVPRHLEMQPAKFIYGCSMRKGNFATSSLTSIKIDCLVKMDVQRLLAIGNSNPPPQVTGVVDKRTVNEIISADQEDDHIKIFALPEGWYAQECSFVPRHYGTSEDDGWLVTYVFDESQLDNHGEASLDCRSELWIIDATGMKDIVAKVQLPQRVPYGMHGNWFPEEQITSQRGYVRCR